MNADYTNLKAFAGIFLSFLLFLLVLIRAHPRKSAAERFRVEL
jgi:hypothetical protein